MTSHPARRCGAFLPVLTVLACAALAGVQSWLSPAQRLEWRYAGPAVPTASPWYAPLSATLVHSSTRHLVGNLGTLLLVGSAHETTEGPLRWLAVAWGGATLGVAGQGLAAPDKYVLGASTVVYALAWSQLALLALNWAEMPLRWFRLALAVVVVVLEGVLFAVAFDEHLAYAAHAGAALAGTLVSLVLGSNVARRRWERGVGVAAACAYTALATLALASAQPAAATLAAVLVPGLALACVCPRRAAESLDDLHV